MTRKTNRLSRAGHFKFWQSVNHSRKVSAVMAVLLVASSGAVSAGTLDAFGASVDDPHVTAPVGFGASPGIGRGGENDRGGASWSPSVAPMDYCERAAGMWTCLQSARLREPGIAARSSGTAPVPLPASTVLLGSALLLLIAAKRRKGVRR